MASLKKRGNAYSIVFKSRIDGKQRTRTFALGTKYKKIADQKRVEYEKLYDAGEINPFDPAWNLSDYEAKQIAQESSGKHGLLEQLVNEFLASKTDVTEKTRETYREILERFTAQVGKTMPIHQVHKGDIADFCLRKGLANASKKNYHRHLKSFFNWLVENDVIEENPCKQVKLPKVKDNLSEKIIEERDLKQIFSVYRDTQAKKRRNGTLNSEMAKKNWFRPFVMLGFYTGMRRKELIQLDWVNVHLEDRMIRITDTKNAKERTVPILDPLYDVLKAWHRFSGRPKMGLVLPHPKSTPKRPMKLQGDHLYRVFKSYVKKARLKSTINVHSLRHSCATFLFRKGFDILEVNRWLDHSSLDVTKRYVQLIPGDLLKKAKETGLILK